MEKASSMQNHEKAGYRIMPFVEEFIPTDAGDVPMIRTELTYGDILSNINVRLNIKRDDYKIASGLYAVGRPSKDSPVVVTANYKLSFDHLRKALYGRTAWILILDTLGVNVWCAAGKGTFGTNELKRQIGLTGIEKVVGHRKLILPQLAATGVSAVSLKKQTGFEVIWGPVRTEDLGLFLDNDMNADKKMRQVTFGLIDRLVVIPVEASLALKPAFYILAALFILSGISPDIFSFKIAIDRWPLSFAAVLMGIFAGTVLTPVLLPFVYGNAFAMKGLITGFAAGLPVALFWGSREGAQGMIALMLITVSISSYLAMNFTGTTPFTSPSGVEKEMRIGIPLQVSAVILAIILWIIAAF